jgi:predicted regulator of Ras-like GTPase activity (Roadblock/LC7/MglB family)
MRFSLKALNGMLAGTDPQQQEINRCRREVARDPESLAFARLADLLLETGDLPQAATVCESGVGRRPEYSSGHAVLGEIYYRVGLVLKAEPEFREAIRLDPANLRARYRVSEICLARGDIEEAIGQLEQMLFWRPDHLEAKKSLSYALAARNAAAPSVTVTGGGQTHRPECLPTGREEEFVARLLEQPAVDQGLLVNIDGLPVAGSLGPSVDTEAVAAMVASIFTISAEYVDHLHLGVLERGLIEGSGDAIRVIGYGDLILAFTLAPGVSLGAADLAVETALRQLDRQRRALDDAITPGPEQRNDARGA